MAKARTPEQRAALLAGHSWHRYNTRDLELRCRCVECTADWGRHNKVYKEKVRAEIRAGQRVAPGWFSRAEQRGQERDREIARRRSKRRDEARAKASRLARELQALMDRMDIECDLEVYEPRNRLHIDLRMQVRYPLERID